LKARCSGDSACETVARTVMERPVASEAT
jgi:hypothetical protein